VATATPQSLDVPIDEAAALLFVRPSTIRGRLQSGELQGTEQGGRRLVHLDPQTTWIRVADASGLLGISTSTVNQYVHRDELVGKRLRSGRWAVKLGSVLLHPKVNKEVLAHFTGEEPPAPFEPPPRRRAQPRRALYLQLPVELDEVLERGREQYGTYNALVEAAVQALVVEGMNPTELHDLHAEREIFRERSEAVEAKLREASEQLEARAVDALYCPRCEKLVALDEWGYQEHEDGSVSIFHAEHEYSAGGRLRAGTVMARRFAADAN
jgi:hypothetical protein